jgi:hypothetical protein
MVCTCSLERIGLSQKEHGCRPSRAQMILPQDKQFGAVSNRGCIEALHWHFRLSEESDGFVLSSREAIADVRSLMLEVLVVLCGVEAPELCAGVLGGLDFKFGRSEIREPAADGGNLGCPAGLRSRAEAGEDAS